MKEELPIPRGRPTVTIRLTRDSVAAGDDADAPHEREVEVPPIADPIALVSRLYPGYLPSVAGAGHSWGCVLNGRRIATVQGNGAGVRAEVSGVDYGDENHVHFSYASATW